MPQDHSLWADSVRIAEITKLRANLAEREAEIAQLRGAIGTWERCEPNELQDAEAGLIACMSKPPSTSYLKQWEKEKYGEPVAWLATSRFMLDSYTKRKTNYVHINDIVQTPLYARKEK